MFDPITEAFIQSAPKLPELDLEQLPLMLTDAHVQIASLRIQLTEQNGEIDADLNGTGLSSGVVKFQRQRRGPKPAQGNALGRLADPLKSPARAPHTAANEPPFQGFGLVGSISQGVALGWYEIGPLALEPRGLYGFQFLNPVPFGLFLECIRNGNRYRN